MDVRIFQKMKPEIIFKSGTADDVFKFISDLSKEEIENEKILRLPLNKALKEKLISRNLSDKEKDELRAHINSFVEKDYEKMRLFLEEIRAYWNNEVSDIFFRNMENLTGRKIENKFTCYLTNSLPGLYFDDYIITIPYHNFYETESKQYRLSFASFILAEEIVHLIYYDIWRDIFDKKLSIQQITERLWPKNEWIIWKIGEVIPEYFLVENPVFRKFGWNKIDRVKSYPWVKDFRKFSDDLWKNKRDFKDFVINLHKHCNCLPN